MPTTKKKKTKKPILKQKQHQKQSVVVNISNVTKKSKRRSVSATPKSVPQPQGLQNHTFFHTALAAPQPIFNPVPPPETKQVGTVDIFKNPEQKSPVKELDLNVKGHVAGDGTGDSSSRPSNPILPTSFEDTARHGRDWNPLFNRGLDNYGFYGISPEQGIMHYNNDTVREVARDATGDNEDLSISGINPMGDLNTTVGQQEEHNNPITPADIGEHYGITASSTYASVNRNFSRMKLLLVAHRLGIPEKKISERSNKEILREKGELINDILEHLKNT